MLRWSWIILGGHDGDNRKEEKTMTHPCSDYRIMVRIFIDCLSHSVRDLKFLHLTKLGRLFEGDHGFTYIVDTFEER